MKKIKYKSLQQLRAEIIKKVLDQDTIPGEANEDGKFEVRC